VLLEGLGQSKNPVTSSGIELANFWLEAQCLNHLRFRVPHFLDYENESKLKKEKAVYQIRQSSEASTSIITWKFSTCLSHMYWQEFRSKLHNVFHVRGRKLENDRKVYMFLYSLLDVK
jgi:hypothetical protein